MSMKRLKKIPKFASIQQEANFWQTRDSTAYIDWTQAEKMHFPYLKPSIDTDTDSFRARTSNK